ncbi:hypothetical protein E5D57_002502 [Metarhizium anisopliae]|nr:hypothetical protein E5D57_002502 [Metarhizium anisopliae]
MFRCHWSQIRPTAGVLAYSVELESFLTSFDLHLRNVFCSSSFELQDPASLGAVVLFGRKSGTRTGTSSKRLTTLATCETCIPPLQPPILAIA